MVKSASSAVPNWPPQWELAKSTAVMPCNYSGLMTEDSNKFLGQFGLVDFDWSHGKELWASTSPMNCEEVLVEAANALKAVNPEVRVFVYRNLVKALPWFTDVRVKLDDASVNQDWFLHFKPDGPYVSPNCTTSAGQTKCSTFYHDQDQTPHYPAQCTTGPCDCGSQPCGEYLWDHATGGTNLQQYLVQQFILGPQGLGNKNISGFYLDDQWSNKSDPIAPWMPKDGFCDHNEIGGPTEVEVHCVEDMGLTKARVQVVYDAWRSTVAAVEEAIVGAEGFAWAQFRTTSTPFHDSASCSAFFRTEACSNSSSLLSAALLWEWTLDQGVSPLPQPEIDAAAFLLARGPYAWIGYAWNGCSSGSDPPGAGGKPYVFPDILHTTVGEPSDVCYEKSTNVFQRDYSKANVAFDCNTMTPTITPK